MNVVADVLQLTHFPERGTHSINEKKQAFTHYKRLPGKLHQ